MFPSYLTASLAPHHEQFWAWVDALRTGQRPQPLVAIWSRGHAKSTSAELSCVVVARRRVRHYVLYVSATQDQADKHVETIAALLESDDVARDDPGIGQRLVGKYGHSRGWRRSRLRTASGFTVDALGLDVAARGIKVEGQRPDYIILDDIDNEDDTPETTEKKVRTLTQKILPTGTADAAVLAIQNVVLPDGIFARFAGLTSERAEFLADRIVSGPVPAIAELAYQQDDHGRATITGGVATWAGLPIADCQRIINTEGISAFLVERQHMVRQRGAKLYQPAYWDGKNRYDLDDDDLLSRIHARYLFWDTAESEGATSAYTACMVVDLLPVGHGYAALIRDVWRERINPGDLLSVIEARAERFDVTVWRADGRADQPLEAIIVEHASTGKTVVPTLRKQARTPRYRYMVQGFPPKFSKDKRHAGAAMQAAAGRWWLPYTAEWLPMFWAELMAIPQSTYRDMTDCLSMAGIYLGNILAVPELKPSEVAALLSGEEDAA